MSTYDNKDMSSTGTTIEIVAYHDNHLSQVEFDDWLNNEGGNEPVNKLSSDYSMYAVGEPIKAYGKTELNKMLRADLITEFNLINPEDDGEDYTRAEMIAELKEVDLEDHTQAIIAMHFYQQIKDKLRAVYIDVRGFCQGDLVTIIDVGSKPDKSTIGEAGEYYENLFYRSPITFLVTITKGGDSTEYYPDSYLDSRYEWDHADARKACLLAGVPEVSIDAVMELLPDSLNHA